MAWTSFVRNAIISFSRSIVNISDPCSRCLLSRRDDPWIEEVREEPLESTTTSKEHHTVTLGHVHTSTPDALVLDDYSRNEAEMHTPQQQIKDIKPGNLGPIDLESQSPTMLELIQMWADFICSVRHDFNISSLMK